MAEMLVQTPDEVVAFLKAQHDLIEEMFDEVLLASDPRAREKPFVELRQLLVILRANLDPDEVQVGELAKAAQ